MRRVAIFLLSAAAVLVGVVGLSDVVRPSAPIDPDHRVTIVDGPGDIVDPVVRPTPVMLPLAAESTTATVMEEAPESLKAMHAAVQAGRSANKADDEARIRNLFAGERVFAGQQVDVTCARARCEVRGTATGDEVSTRLAFESDAMLDAVAARGYSVGTSIVSGRERGSEFVVYLESATPI